MNYWNRGGYTYTLLKIIGFDKAGSRDRLVRYISGRHTSRCRKRIQADSGDLDNNECNVVLLGKTIAKGDNIADDSISDLF